jgi:hypothetical protein
MWGGLLHPMHLKNQRHLMYHHAFTNDNNEM